MLERHIAFWGRPPRQAAANGGYASGRNLDQAKACGVRDMAFHRKAGLRVEDTPHHLSFSPFMEFDRDQLLDRPS